MSKSLSPRFAALRIVSPALAVLLTLGACKKELVMAPPVAAPVVTKVPAPTALLVDAPPLQVRYLQAKGKVQYEMGSERQEATLALRLHRDSVIWISVSKVGFEGVRLMLTPDSVFMLNKLQKTAFVGSFAALQTKYQVPVDFRMLQAALLANYLPDPADTDASAAPEDPVQTIQRTKGTLKVEQFINREHHRLVKLAVRDQQTGDGLVANYDDFRPVGNAGTGSSGPAASREFPFASLLQIQQAPSPQAPPEQIRTILISLNHKNVTVPEGKLDFPFAIPADYERR